MVAAGVSALVSALALLFFGALMPKSSLAVAAATAATAKASSSKLSELNLPSKAACLTRALSSSCGVVAAGVSALVSALASGLALLFFGDLMPKSSLAPKE